MQEGLPVVRKRFFAHTIIYFPLEFARGWCCHTANGKGLVYILTDRRTYSSAFETELDEYTHPPLLFLCCVGCMLRGAN